MKNPEGPVLLQTITKHHEDQFLNFSVSVASRNGNTQIETGEQTLLDLLEYEMIRLDGQSRVLARQFDTVDGTQVLEVNSSWDGHQQRAIADRLVGSDTASISDSESRAVSDVGFNRAIGYRVLGPLSVQAGSVLPVQRTMSEWMDDISAKGFPHSVAVVTDENFPGQQLVEFRATIFGTLNQRYLFDLEKGGMLVYSEVVHGSGDGASGDYVRVQEARNIDGVWVPVSGLEASYNRGHLGLETRTYFEVKEIKIGEVRPEDLIVEFPPGTEVIDQTLGIAYRIEDGDEVTSLPLYSAATGQVSGGGSPVDVAATSQSPVVPPPAQGEEADSRSIASVDPAGITDQSEGHSQFIILTIIAAFVVLLLMLAFKYTRSTGGD